jgi:hypothetical protein
MDIDCVIAVIAVIAGIKIPRREALKTPTRNFQCFPRLKKIRIAEARHG